MVALLLSIGITAVEAVRYGVSTCYAQITKQQTDVFGKCKSYMYTKLTVTSAPCGSPCSTEPAAYPRVQFPQNPTRLPWEAPKRSESVLTLKTIAAAPCVLADPIERISLTHKPFTSYEMAGN